MTQKKIDVGQYWRLVDGCVALVTGRNADDTHWLVTRVEQYGHILSGVGESDSRFEELLTPEAAEILAQENFNAGLRMHLHLSVE